MLRYLTAGESHGPCLIGVMDGFPAGVKVDEALVARSLARRRQAPGRSSRQAQESDPIRILSGLHRGVTTGAPIAVEVGNAGGPFVLDDGAVPRPGHADLAGMLKYGLTAASVVRERASARETAARTALGAFCLRLLESLGVSISSRVTGLGRLRGSDPRALARALEAARRSGRSVGGVFEVEARGVPVGLGSHAQWDRRLSSRIAAQLMGLNAVKGLEFGSGFAFCALKGDEALDLFARKGGALERASNLAGGLEGGMTNGMPLVLRAAVRPVPGQRVPVRSLDLRSGAPAAAAPGRSDVTAVFAAAVIAEHLLAFALADAVLEKFGGDSLGEIRGRVESWRESIRRRARR